MHRCQVIVLGLVVALGPIAMTPADARRGPEKFHNRSGANWQDLRVRSALSPLTGKEQYREWVDRKFVLIIGVGF